MNSSEKQQATGNEQDSRLVNNLLEHISTIDGLTNYYLMDRHGKIVAQSSVEQQPSEKVIDFIGYCIVSGIKIRQVLGTKGPARLWFSLENEEKLLIMPGAGLIIALFLGARATIDEVGAQLAAMLTNMTQA